MLERRIGKKRNKELIKNEINEIERLKKLR